MTKSTGGSNANDGKTIKVAGGKLNAKYKLSTTQKCAISALREAPVPSSSSGVVSNLSSSFSSPSPSRTSTAASTPSTNDSVLTSSQPPRALSFTVPKKDAYLIDFVDPEDVKNECMKYVSGDDELPSGQAHQLAFLINKFKLKDLQMALIKLITIVGGQAPDTFLPIATTKTQLVKDFLCLIYDHKSMLIDTSETTSYR